MLEEHELISIVVPVYNVEKYLKRCIESLINQTYKNIEIILINDGSKDNSLSICKEYEKKDERIKVIDKENEGLGYTRNKGIECANGKYIAFIDSDDYIDLDFYEKLYNSAKKNNSDMVFSSFKKVNGENKVYEIHNSKCSQMAYIGDEARKNILRCVMGNCQEDEQLPISACMILYKKEIMDKYEMRFFSERQYISEDFLFNIEYILKINSASIVEDTYYYYCDNQNSLTRKYNPDRFEKIKDMYYYLIEFMGKNGLLDETKKGIDNYTISHIRACLKQEKLNNKSEAYMNIKKICNDDIVKIILQDGYYATGRQKMFDYLLKTKQYKLIYYIIKIKK